MAPTDSDDLPPPGRWEKRAAIWSIGLFVLLRILVLEDSIRGPRLGEDDGWSWGVFRLPLFLLAWAVVMLAVLRRWG